MLYNATFLPSRLLPETSAIFSNIYLAALLVDIFYLYSNVTSNIYLRRAIRKKCATVFKNLFVNFSLNKKKKQLKKFIISMYVN